MLKGSSKYRSKRESRVARRAASSERSVKEGLSTSITVLGGFGFIGNHLVERLRERGHSVTVLGRAVPSADNTLEPANVRCLYGDFANASDVRAAIEGARVVFHLIGSTVPQPSNENPCYDVESQIVPTLSFLKLCVEAGVRQVIFASSGGTVYGVPQTLPISEEHPTYPICSYGISKLSIEHYMRLFHRLNGLDMTVLRLSNPYGPRQNIRRGQGVIGTFCNRLAAGESLQIWGDGSVVRDYIHISDVVRAMEQVIGHASGYRVYNVGSGIGTSIKQLIDHFRAIVPRAFKVKFLPPRAVDLPINVLDISRFQADYQWRPEVDIRRGLCDTIEWYRQAR